jgi:hypothetical protein
VADHAHDRRFGREYEQAEESKLAIRGIAGATLLPSRLHKGG